jgi:hypothetical protein
MIFSTYWADEEEEPDLTLRWIEGSIDIVRVLRIDAHYFQLLPHVYSEV